MNDPLKFKWHTLYGQVQMDRGLMEAWTSVKRNHGAGGIDGMTIEAYAKDEKENILRLQEKLHSKEYRPKPVRRVYIPKKDGKKRPLGIPVLEDRIVQQRLVDILQPKFEKDIFHNWSMGYRPNRDASSAIQVIIKRVEEGYNWIYDCDIKGFFDNIPHKKLMKVLNKYIADGTVLDMIWSWLKAGYMEDGKSYPTRAGTPQGGVISPLLANIYLNELDWELHKAKVYFVRYADDFLLFAKSEEEIDRAGETAKKILEELGLEMAMNKTKIVDFRNEDFDFLGFHFSHWKEGKEGMEYTITPTRKSLKDFKMKIKKATQRKYTLSREEWVSKVNPIIRGKVNYYLSVHKALKVFRDRGVVTHCNCKRMGQELHAIDGYTRQRLRMCFIHKHPTVRKAMGKRQRWNIEFFVSIGLVPANWYYFNKLYGYTKEQYVERQMLSNKQRHVRYIEKLKKKGIAYYTKKRCEKIALACG